MFYPDKIVRIKVNNERKEFEKRYIFEVRHFPEVDVVFYKENHRLFRKELVIPLTSLSDGQMHSYRNIIRAYTDE